MPIFFIVVTVYIVLENLAYASVQAWLLWRVRPRPAWLMGAVYGWAVLMAGLFVLDVLQPLAWKPFMREWLYFPLGVEMAWNLLLLQVIFPAALLIMIFLRRKRAREKAMPKMAPVENEPALADGLSRRRFIYLVSYGVAPATAIGMGVHGALSRDDLRVRQFPVPIASLPPELEGFTIAHVSDIHSGVFVGPERLKTISDATNDLKADLIAVTGDIINREMTEFPDALAALRRMESRYGMYLCEGNHDIIPGPTVFARACAANGLNLIYNTAIGLPVRGCRLILGGVSWNTVFYYKDHPEVISRLYPPRQAGDARILLAHHPHLFDVAQETDLVLSGHTHGGQIMFGDMGLGRIRFKYCSGRYQRRDTTLVVSNGCGDWFPCRIGAPAEIGLLTLTAARATG